jgi:hypothetical protein
MRLGQLARKLALRPSQIVDFLASKEIFPEEGSNAKLSDEITQRIVLHFAPERLRELMSVEENTDEVIPETVEAKEALSQQKEEVKLIVEEQPLIELAAEQEKPEVIKAPKVELSGLKVLGKIDLPEPKKKPEVPETTDSEVETNEIITAKEKKPRRSEGKEYAQRRASYQRPERNPIAEERERKAREEEEKRKAKLEREKEKRTQYYLKRVKTGQPTKAMKIVSEPLESFAAQEVRPAPKTWWGKFMRWLNT